QGCNGRPFLHHQPRDDLRLDRRERFGAGTTRHLGKNSSWRHLWRTQALPAMGFASRRPAIRKDRIFTRASLALGCPLSSVFTKTESPAYAPASSSILFP